MMRGLTCVLVTLGTVGMLGTATMAHEHRTVSGYEFVVGWRVEPAYLGEINGVDLGVTVAGPAASTASGATSAAEAQPVEGLEETLQVEITSGPQRRVLELRPRFRMPGRYTADVLPTRSGDYRFRFFGMIGDTPIDATFDSADGKFNSVQPVAAIQFPQPLPDVAQVDQGVSGARQLSLAALVLGALGLVSGGWALARTSRPRAGR